MNYFIVLPEAKKSKLACATCWCDRLLAIVSRDVNGPHEESSNRTSVGGRPLICIPSPSLAVVARVLRGYQCLGLQKHLGNDNEELPDLRD